MGLLTFSVLKEVFPGFPQVSADVRVKMKKAVKNWLKKELAAKFSECVIVTKSADGKEHQSYGVPGEVLEKFKGWARAEMENLGIETS